MRIVNGTIVDPEKEEMYSGTIYIKDQKVICISRNEDETNPDFVPFSECDNEEEIDAAGCLIFPGLIDTHVHFRDPGFTEKEDIYSGAAAAEAGGYTQVVLMANTNPHVDNVDTLKYVLNKGRETSIRINTCANVTMEMKGVELTDMNTLKAAGAVGFTDDGVPIVDERLALEAMRTCAILEVPISFHEENPDLISENGINRGEASSYYGIQGSPANAEISMVKRDINLMKKCREEYGVSPTVVIQHISTKEGAQLVREAKKEGLDIHAEGTPHHFSLTEQALIEHGSNAKMNPPLRTEDDRKAIVEGIKDDTIDLIATDHAPHTKEEKNRPITKAPSGIIGLETALPLAYTELVSKGGMSPIDLAKRMSYSPAKLYHLEGGVIKEGKDADITIFNPDVSYVVESFESKASNSPFIGKIMQGAVVKTICAGKIVYSDLHR